MSTTPIMTSSMSALKTTEIAVEMTCNSCVRAVQSSLSKVDGIGSFRVELENQRVYIDSLLPDSVLLTAVEASGRRARIVGHSTTGSDGASLGAAVAEFKFTPCQGVVRFTQLTADNTLVEGLVSGLAPNARHGLQVHEYGDLSEDWRSVGPAFGASASLGDIESDEAGKGSLIVEVPLKVSDIIGRSLVVHTQANPQSNATNEAPGLAWAVLARSAGKNENPKVLCACDGTVIWNS